MSRPQISALHHTTVVATDLARATAFYNGVLGLPILPLPSADLAGVILWFDLGHGQALHVLRGTPAPDGQAHFALRVETVPPWRAHLAAQNVAIQEPDVQLVGKERIFLNDPDGNLIELSQ
jgi:glyoxylase I family protein